jgi:hypothetical protein
MSPPIIHDTHIHAAPNRTANMVTQPSSNFAKKRLQCTALEKALAQSKMFLNANVLQE